MKKSCKIILRDNMALQEGERVLIVTDDPLLPVGQALYETARELGVEATLMVSAPRAVHGEEPNELVAAAMLEADVILLPTSTSMSHTNAKTAAVKKGARVGSMPTITPAMFTAGAMTADYSAVERLTLQVTELLTRAKTARLEKDGHVLTMSLQGRTGIPSTGIYRNRGEAGNLPSGEAYIAPLEGSCNGSMLVDGSVPGLGIVSNAPLVVHVRDGLLEKIDGPTGGKLDTLMRSEANRNVAELGIGTNTSARLTGNILEDEKLYGSVHVAFGTNSGFGGTVKADCHIDFVIQAPSLYLDEVLVLDQGKLLL